MCEDPSERQRTGSDPEYLIELIDTEVLGVVCLNKINFCYFKQARLSLLLTLPD